MKIDGKGIQFLLWRCFRYSITTFFSCIKKYPLISGIFFVFLLTYIFLPSIFFILILTSPIFAGSAIFIKLRSKSKRGKVVVVQKKENEEPSSPSYSRQKSVRRNAPQKNIECDAEGNNITNPLDEILGRNKSSKEKQVIVEENEGKRSSISDNGIVDINENVYDSIESKFSGFGETDVEEEDEEDVRRGKEAVEWTENDQKNLMDLGNSELERNMRLESLIARRRSRKSFKMDNGNALLGPPIAPIQIGKGNPYNYPRNPKQDEWYTPGSAPPVFGGNQFDLPYDPLEEKPVLTGGSFDQEFMPLHHKDKDMVYCRHESFCCEPFFSFEPIHDFRSPHFDLSYSSEKNIMERNRNPVLGGREGSVTDLVQLESAEDSNEVEVQTEIDSIKDNESISSSSSESTERILSRRKFPQMLSVDVQRNPHGAPPKIPYFDKNSLIASPSLDDHTFYKVPSHTPTYSIASDLQVEVSESGSPRPMGLHDGAFSFADEDSVAYDADIDKDLTPTGEGKWGGLYYQEPRYDKEPEDVGEGKTDPEQVKESENEKMVSEIIAIMGEPKVDSHVESVKHPKLALEQVSVASSSFLSPTTVLLQRTPRDQSADNSLDISIEGERDSVESGNVAEEADSAKNQEKPSVSEKKEEDKQMISSDKSREESKIDSTNNIIADQITDNVNQLVDSNSETEKPAKEGNTEPSKSGGESKNSKVTEEHKELINQESAKDAPEPIVNGLKDAENTQDISESTQSKNKEEDKAMISPDKSLAASKSETPTKPSEKERSVKSDEGNAPRTSSHEEGSPAKIDSINNTSKVLADQLAQNVNQLVDDIKGETQTPSKEESDAQQPSNREENTKASKPVGETNDPKVVENGLKETENNNKDKPDMVKGEEQAKDVKT